MPITENSVRPIYETELDRTREDQVFDVLSRVLNFDCIGVPKLSVVDKLLCRNGTLIAVAEFKTRTIKHDAYPTYMLSSNKHTAMLALSASLKVPAVLIVMFSDLIVFTKLRSGYEQKSGGRTDRGDHKDVGACVFIPMQEFKTITGATSKQEVSHAVRKQTKTV